MSEEHEQFMRMALDEAAKGKAEGNVAVASVIVKDGAVIAVGRNLAATTFDPTAHAETVALREAGKATRQTSFPGCTLYTTFEPCPMCCGAILICGIDTLVMGGRPSEGESRWSEYNVENLIRMTGSESKINVVTGVLVEECGKLRYSSDPSALKPYETER